MNDVVERFSSIAKLVETLRSRKTNEVFSGSADSLDKSAYSEIFTGSKTYEEAENLLLHGGYTAVLPELKKAAAPTPTRPRRTPGTAPAGYAPHVPNSIQGLPNSMIFSKVTPQKVKNIELIYNISVGLETTTEEMTQAGKKLLAVVKRLEGRNIRIKLSVILAGVFSGGKANQTAVMILDLKDYRESINFKKMTFPLIHPAALRRIGFRWLETTPAKIASSFNKHYGFTASGHRINRALNSKAKIIYAKNIIGYDQTPEEIEKNICL